MARVPALHHFREDLRSQRLKRIGVAEESRDVNQDVLIKRTHFIGVLLKEPDVLLDGADLVQHHSPLHPATNCGELVIGEIHAGRAAQQGKDPLQLLPGRCLIGGVSQVIVMNQRVTRNSKNLASDVCRRQHQVDDAGGNCRARHAVKLGRLGLLRHGDSAGGFDFLQSDRPVGIAAGKDHAKRLCLCKACERSKKEVDRPVLRTIFGPGR